MLQKNCLLCNLVFYKRDYESKKDWENRHKFCSRICADKYWTGKRKSQYGFVKGCKAIHPIKKGEHLSPATQFKKGNTPPFKGKRFPQVAGANNNHWKGGVTKVQDAVRKLPEYKAWRITILIRDNYTCQLCGQRGGDKHVDHYPVQFALLLEQNSITTIQQAIDSVQLWTTQGRTLCVPCHKKTETYLKKINKNPV